MNEEHRSKRPLPRWILELGLAAVLPIAGWGGARLQAYRSADDGRVARLDAEVGSIWRAVGELKGDVTGLQVQYASQDGRTTRIESKVDKMDAKLDDLIKLVKRIQ